ncbi:hypothetical protein LTV02_08420 [Nocardia yamanashiensis]|uniref:hypothetical protein n=1 Tax=Nocardia yamanashiensis TaxID=209247 RepID=UPI001E3D40D2|nr:hypothetical protein [Nocardia yamanashiensis]UGT43396.1 hypothetical protein LTV02_08420 [Nocardia yamanashiensis]
MTDSLMLAAMDTVSELVNSTAASATGTDLPSVTWTWDSCARLAAPGADRPEFLGTIHLDLSGPEAEAALLAWADALELSESTSPHEAADGRRAFTGLLAGSLIRIAALVESAKDAMDFDTDYYSVVL